MCDGARALNSGLRPGPLSTGLHAYAGLEEQSACPGPPAGDRDSEVISDSDRSQLQEEVRSLRSHCRVIALQEENAIFLVTELTVTKKSFFPSGVVTRTYFHNIRK